MTILDSPSRGKRDWRKYWFAIVPGKAIINKKLSNGAVRCLGVMALLSREFNQDPRNITRVCATPQATLANKLDVHRQTVNRWIKLLTQLGYLELIGRTRKPGGAYGANRYLVTGYERDHNPGNTLKDALVESRDDATTRKRELAVSDEFRANESGETSVRHCVRNYS